MRDVAHGQLERRIDRLGQDLDTMVGREGRRHATQDLRRSIGRMVVYYDEVEAKIGLLVKNTANRIDNRSLTVSDWYHDTSLDRKGFSPGGKGIEVWLQVCTYAFQVLRRDVFHLDLVIAIPQIDVIELLLAGRPDICH